MPDDTEAEAEAEAEAVTLDAIIEKIGEVAVENGMLSGPELRRGLADAGYAIRRTPAPDADRAAKLEAVAKELKEMSDE